MPSQYDVFKTTNGTYVIVLQSDALDGLVTRVVARLVPDDWPDPPLKHLSPTLHMGELTFRMHTTQLATLTLSELGTFIGSAAHLRDDILRATDFLLTGY